jgi:hypothetical protein
MRAIGDRLIVHWLAALRVARTSLTPVASELRVRASFAALGGLATVFLLRSKLRAGPSCTASRWRCSKHDAMLAEARACF